MDYPGSCKIMGLAGTIAKEFDAKDETSAFTIVDIARLRWQYQLWTEALSSVKPFYAIKCNNDDKIISELARLGCGFDCASKGELKQIFALLPHSEVVLAHPVKSRDCLRFAVDNNVYNMTFDSVPELKKMMEISRYIRPILRIRVQGFKSLVDLNEKFGADEATSKTIFETASALGAKIHGISFHIGSGVTTVGPMQRTLAYARRLFDYGIGLGHPMRLLDIGGGLICTSRNEFIKLGRSIENSLQRNFSDLGVQVIAEPGRFFATDVQYAVVRVDHVGAVGVNEVDNSMHNVFINDGVYGSFNYVLTERRSALGTPLKKRNGLIKANIWGPTGCSLDIIERNRLLPRVEEGDWLIYPGNGAYSSCLATTFNGIPIPPRIYVDLDS